MRTPPKKDSPFMHTAIWGLGVRATSYQRLWDCCAAPCRLWPRQPAQRRLPEPMLIQIHTPVSAYVFTYVYTHIPFRINICVYLHIYIYIHIYTHPMRPETHQARSPWEVVAWPRCVPQSWVPRPWQLPKHRRWPPSRPAACICTHTCVSV